MYVKNTAFYRYFQNQLENLHVTKIRLKQVKD